MTSEEHQQLLDGNFILKIASFLIILMFSFVCWSINEWRVSSDRRIEALSADVGTIKEKVLIMDTRGAVNSDRLVYLETQERQRHK